MSVSGIGQSSNVYTPSGAGAGSSLAGTTTPRSDPKAEFLKWAHMTPAQKMRASLLSSMGLTEEQVQAMSPDDRKKVEDKLRQLIEQKVKDSVEKKTGLLVDQKV